MFEGLAVALVTPFRKGAVDREALARLASHLAEAGVRALYPCGCTGEATSLTREERTLVIRTVIEAARGRAAVIAGTGTALTSETIEISQDAIRAGADGVMVISPYSVKPTQEGLLAHYRAVADAVDRPRALFLETSPAPLKHALTRLGFTGGDLRLPLVPVRPETGTAVDQALDRVGVATAARSGH